jgi:phosphopantothenoylcysteine synthetase/decarboxylase
MNTMSEHELRGIPSQRLGNDNGEAPDPDRGRVLYVIVCAAPPAAEVHGLVKLAVAGGWDVCVITTADAANWVDASQLAELTGRPVRSRYPMLDEPEGFPPADAIVVAPATFNTINKFRGGIADNYAVGTLCECLRAGVPIVIAPNVKQLLEEHPAYPASIHELRSWGVHIMDQAPVPRGLRIAPWEAILAEVTSLTEAKHG